MIIIDILGHVGYFGLHVTYLGHKKILLDQDRSSLYFQEYLLKGSHVWFQNTCIILRLISAPTQRVYTMQHIDIRKVKTCLLKFSKNTKKCILSSQILGGHYSGR